jgi:hypothetical protein
MAKRFPCRHEHALMRLGCESRVKRGAFQFAQETWKSSSLAGNMYIFNPSMPPVSVQIYIFYQYASFEMHHLIS